MSKSHSTDIARPKRVLVRVVEDGSAKTFIYKIVDERRFGLSITNDKISKYWSSIRKKLNPSQD